MDICVGKRFHVKKKIGSGSFGEIYQGEETSTGFPVAIKLEPCKTKTPQLVFESKIYFIFKSCLCVPELHWFGQESIYNALVIDLLGKNLQMFHSVYRNFSLKTVLMLADQMLTSLEYIHSKGLLHRDIKPENFLLGLGNRKNIIFIIDFGLAKRFKNLETLEHIPFQENKSIVGTARYSSINSLQGFEQSRRDDLEALGYVLIYFLKGSLPWQGLDQKDGFNSILNMKKSISIENLCENLPNEFVEYLHLVRDLDFGDVPEYSKYRQIFRNLFIQLGFVYDYVFDWSQDEASSSENFMFNSNFKNRIDSFDSLPDTPPVVCQKKNKKETVEQPPATVLCGNAGVLTRRGVFK